MSKGEDNEAWSDEDRARAYLDAVGYIGGHPTGFMDLVTLLADARAFGATHRPEPTSETWACAHGVEMPHASKLCRHCVRFVWEARSEAVSSDLLAKAIRYLNQWHEHTGAPAHVWREHDAEVQALVELMRPASATGYAPGNETPSNRAVDVPLGPPLQFSAPPGTFAADGDVEILITKGGTHMRATGEKPAQAEARESCEVDSDRAGDCPDDHPNLERAAVTGLGREPKGPDGPVTDPYEPCPGCEVALCCARCGEPVPRRETGELTALRKVAEAARALSALWSYPVWGDTEFALHDALEALESSSGLPEGGRMTALRIRAVEIESFSAPATPPQEGCADPASPAIGALPREEVTATAASKPGSGDGGERPAPIPRRDRARIKALEGPLRVGADT